MADGNNVLLFNWQWENFVLCDICILFTKIINSYNASIKRKTDLLDHASGAVEDLDAVPRVPAAVVGREVAFRQVFLKKKNKCIKSIEQL